MGMRRMLGGGVIMVAATVVTLVLALGASAHTASARGPSARAPSARAAAAPAQSLTHLTLTPTVGSLPLLTLHQVLSGRLPAPVLNRQRMTFRHLRAPVVPLPPSVGHSCFVAAGSGPTPDCDAKPTSKFIGGGSAVLPLAGLSTLRTTSSGTR